MKDFKGVELVQWEVNKQHCSSYNYQRSNYIINYSISNNFPILEQLGILENFEHLLGSTGSPSHTPKWETTEKSDIFPKLQHSPHFCIRLCFYNKCFPEIIWRIFEENNWKAIGDALRFLSGLIRSLLAISTSR